MTWRISWPIVLGALILAGGIAGDWLRFPVSPPVGGLSIPVMQGIDGSTLVRTTYLVAAPFSVLLAVGLLLLPWARSKGTLVIGASVAVLALVPGYLVFQDSVWLHQYVEDSTQNGEIHRYMKSTVAAGNSGYVFYIRNAPEFEYLADRANIVMGMLGIGWMLAAIGSVVLITGLRSVGWFSSPRDFARSAAMVFVFGVAILGAAPLIGELRHRQGDAYLARGSYDDAIKAYTSALMLDPVLGHSQVFLVKVSRAYYQREGGEYLLAQPYLAWSEAIQSPESSKVRLRSLSASSVDSPFTESLQRMSARMEAEIWLRQGLSTHLAGKPASAVDNYRRVLRAFPEWRETKFYLARALLELHEYDESVRLCGQLAESIGNPSLKADMYSAMGDAYSAWGKEDLARAAYANANTIDNSGNLWATRGLSGT
jgi:hypothetical protein